jgi:hypothetical protein
VVIWDSGQKYFERKFYGSHSSPLWSPFSVLQLAPRLNEMVAKNQNAIIRERTIHDNFKYIRAAVLIRKKKIPMLLLKLDISKAFDMLSWPFLLELLQAHGFSAT